MPSLRSILTLGMSRSKAQSPIRGVYTSRYYPPKLPRANEKVTLKIIQEFFPNPSEQIAVYEWLPIKGNHLFFESSETADSFFKSLQKAGWGEFSYEIRSLDPGHLYLNGEYETLEALFYNSSNKAVVPSYRVYRAHTDNGKEVYLDERTGAAVVRLSDLKLKEAMKYVTKCQEAA